MIIYGHKQRNVEIGTGQFICPKCSTDRTYKHINMVRYFTLFFIPLFPLGKLGSYIECQTCLTAYKPEEVGAIPGNEQFGDELAARKAEFDQTQKAKRGGVWAVIGAILAAVGCGFLSLSTLIQLTSEAGPTDNLRGFLCLMALCPLPMMLAGVGLVVWGIRARRSVTEVPPAQSLPMG